LPADDGRLEAISAEAVLPRVNKNVLRMKKITEDTRGAYSLVFDEIVKMLLVGRRTCARKTEGLVEVGWSFVDLPNGPVVARENRSAYPARPGPSQHAPGASVFTIVNAFFVVRAPCQ
jgi:hypothetical protein